MKKTNIVKKIDYFFLFAILFFISLIIISYFVRNKIVCFLISFVMAYGLYLLVTFLLGKKNSRVLSAKEDANNIASLRNFLITSGKENAIFYLNKALSGSISGNIIETDNAIYYIHLDSSEAGIYDFNNINKSLSINSKKKYILAESISKELFGLIDSLEQKICFIDFKDFYFDYLKGNVKIPDPIYKQKTQAKNTFKSLLKLALSKDRAKGYFVNGILIFLFSFLYPFRSYYLVFSLALFVLALVSFFEPFRTTSH